MHKICNPSCFISTPVEVLHTVILGPYKYLMGTIMVKLSAEQKREVQAKLSCADYSGIEGRMTSNITRYSQSFVGRDFSLGKNGTIHLGAIFNFRAAKTLAESFEGKSLFAHVQFSLQC